MAVVDINFPGNIAQVGTAANLRDLPSYLIESGTLYIVTSLGRAFAYDSGSVAIDDGTNVIKPNDKTTIQAGRWLYQMDGFAPGPPGSSDNTYSDLAVFKASDIGRKTASLVGVFGVPDGRFNWTLAPAGQPFEADNYDIIKADSTPLSVGAWVRQRTGSISGLFKTPEDFGAKGDGIADDTAALQAALDSDFDIRLIRQYRYTSLTLSRSGKKVFGPGGLVKIAGVDGWGIFLTGSDNTLEDFTVQGPGSAAPGLPSASDSIRVQGQQITEATFAGSISGNILTVNAVTTGALQAGQGISGASVTAGTTLMHPGLAANTWVLSKASTAVLTTMTAKGGARNNKLTRIRVYDAQGSGFRADSAPGTIFTDCESYRAEQNGILICNPGGDGCKVRGGRFITTNAQNGVYVTANDGGPAGDYEFIYDTEITGVTTDDNYDTGIETGAGTVRTKIAQCNVGDSRNPGILLRDCLDVSVTNNTVTAGARAESEAAHDGIAVVPFTKSALFDTRTKISNCTVEGVHNRSGMYIGQSGVSVTNCVFRNSNPVADDGVGLTGYGITMGASALQRIVIQTSRFIGFDRGIDLNFDGAAGTQRNGIEIVGNQFDQCGTNINAFNVVFTGDLSSFFDNRYGKTRETSLQLAGATYQGLILERDNVWNGQMFTGVTATAYNPTTAVRLGLKGSTDTQYILIPENGGQSVLLANDTDTSIGFAIVTYLGTAEAGVIALGGRPGIGTGDTAVNNPVQATDDIKGSVDTIDPGETALVIKYDGVPNLIAERNGADTGLGPRYAKVRLIKGS